MKNIIAKSLAVVSILFLSNCDTIQMSSLSSQAAKIFKNVSPNEKTSDKVDGNGTSISKLQLSEIIEEAPAAIDMSGNFQQIIRSSVNSDPQVLSAQANYQTRLASIDMVKSLNELKFSGVLLGGMEDVSDKQSGLATIITGSKVIYDGGKIESQLGKEELLASAALSGFKLEQNKSAFNALSAWLNLKRYSELNNLIKARLEVLAPLIDQLEKVADAGVGDASQVAAAERTVSFIKVMETDVAQKLAQAEVSFESLFGVPNTSIPFEGVFISEAVSSVGLDDLVSSAPVIKVSYSQYLAAVANLESVLAKDTVDVGFEAKIQTPFGGSGYDSDESIGLVVKKTLRDGGALAAEKQIGAGQVNAALDMLKVAYRETDRQVKHHHKVILAMDDAIELAHKNAKNAKDEISFLRKQLIIGQSTLDSVLSAEARLYDAESKAIDFNADRSVAELSILSVLGQLAPLFDIE